MTAAPDCSDREAYKEYRMLQLLTAKLVLYVCNVDEDSAAAGNAYSEALYESGGGWCAGGGYFPAAIGNRKWYSWRALKNRKNF